MRKLIITAHPNPNGFTHKIAKHFIERSLEKGHQVELIDLYDEKNKQDFLYLDEKNKAILDDRVTEMQKHISWAEELVFVYPVRRYDAPAILKNWFDVNFSAGFAYKYKKGSLLPHQYLKGKKARFFVTTGAPTWLRYTPVGRGVFINMIVGRLLFVGIKTRSFTIFGNMHVVRSQDDRQRFLDKVERIAGR